MEDQKVARFFGYQALNKCCRDWMLLGWPADESGKPKHRDVSRHGVYTATCPKCHKEIHFRITQPDMECMAPVEGAQPATLVGGTIKVAKSGAPVRA